MGLLSQLWSKNWLCPSIWPSPPLQGPVAQVLISSGASKSTLNATSSREPPAEKYLGLRQRFLNYGLGLGNSVIPRSP